MVSSADKTSLPTEKVRTLEGRLNELDALQEQITQERLSILETLKAEECDTSSVQEISPLDSIETLGFSQDIVSLIGKKGLGIRRVDQLLSYSSTFLIKQIESYIEHSPRFRAADSSSAGNIVTQIEECLQRRGCTLSS